MNQERLLTYNCPRCNDSFWKAEKCSIIGWVSSSGFNMSGCGCIHTVEDMTEENLAVWVLSKGNYPNHIIKGNSYLYQKDLPHEEGYHTRVILASENPGAEIIGLK